MRLNHRSGAYFVKHLPQIAGFIPFPTITPSETYFGSQETYKPDQCTDFEWPTQDSVKELQSVEDFSTPKIKTITIK